jgi:hypothetical protein
MEALLLHKLRLHHHQLAARQLQTRNTDVTTLEEEEGFHGVFKRLRRNGHQLIKGSCKELNTDCHSWEAQPPK